MKKKKKKERKSPLIDLLSLLLSLQFFLSSILKVTVAATFFQVCGTTVCCNFYKIFVTTVIFLCLVQNFENRKSQNSTRTVLLQRRPCRQSSCFGFPWDGEITSNLMCGLSVVREITMPKCGYQITQRHLICLDI